MGGRRAPLLPNHVSQIRPDTGLKLKKKVFFLFPIKLLMVLVLLSLLRTKSHNSFMLNFPPYLCPISVKGVIRGGRWGIGHKGGVALSSHHIWTFIPSVRPSVSPSVSPSISPSVSPSVSPSISPSVHTYICDEMPKMRKEGREEGRKKGRKRGKKEGRWEGRKEGWKDTDVPVSNVHTLV
jgi:hypothetical protein